MEFAEIADWAISNLSGPLVGAVLGAGGTWVTMRLKRRDTVAAEARVRQERASAQVRDALTQLRSMDPDPDLKRRREEGYRLLGAGDFEAAERLPESDQAALAAWEDIRAELVVAVEAAAGDLKNRKLRERLSEVCLMLRFSDGPERNAHQMEPTTRRIAISHGLECISAFRRGERRLPARSADYTNTLALADIYREELESYRTR